MSGEQEIASMYVGIRGDAGSALTALKQTQDAMKQASGQAQQAASGFNNVQGQLNNLRNPLGSLQNTIMGVAASWGLLKAAQGAWDLGMTTARVHEMDAVLRSLAANSGVAESAVMAGVEAIKKMGIETQVAQQTMAQFTRYQMDAAKAADLARVAQDAAVLSGQNSSEAMAGLIYGITTYNQRVIRTYGLNVDMSNAFDAMAASVGKTTEELTEAEKVQAAMNGVLAEGTRITGAYAAAMEEPGKRWRSLPRYVNEIKVALGEAFLPVVGAAADGLTDMAKAVLENATAFTDMLRPIGDAMTGVIQFVTALGTVGIKSVGAAAKLQAVNTEIVNMAGRSVDGAQGLHQVSTEMLNMASQSIPAVHAALLGLRAAGLDFRQGWEAFQEVGEIQEGIAEKMERTADAAAYMSRNVSGGFEEMSRLAAEYAAELERADKVAWQGVSGEAQAKKIRLDAMLKYNQAVWAYGQANGVATNTLYGLIAAEQQAAVVANAEEAARWKVMHANRQTGMSYQALIPIINAQIAAVRELERAQLAAANAEGRSKGRSAREDYYSLLQQAESAGGGGPDVGKQIAERRAQWERERVEGAQRAALAIKYWEQDQSEWIADNAATLSAELQAEFAARTAAVRAEADQIKETDAALAQELLGAEADYQQEKASIASDENLSEEERAAKMAILERENAERVERAKETAALENQLREEERQREIQQMREAGAAGGQAFAEEIEKALRKVEIEDENRLKRQAGANERAKKGYGQIFDDAIVKAQELWGLVTNILDAPTSGTAPRGGHYGNYIPGAGYAEGGVVPGPAGMPQVAIVHGGEKILPPNRVENAGTGGVTVIVTGPIYASTPEQAVRAGEGIGRGIRMAAKSGGIAV